MNSEKILITNCNILDAVGNKLMEILKNLEDILFHLEPLSNYDEKNDSIFTNLNDKENNIIILSNIIYDNMNKVKITLHDFIKNIPPSYTYYTSFYYNDFIILKEIKRKQQKREHEDVNKMENNNESENEKTELDKKEIADMASLQIRDEEKRGNLNYVQVKNIYNNSSTTDNKMLDKNINSSEQNSSVKTNDFFYFSFLIDLEYSNLIYMKKCEEEIDKYLINTN
ncbi:conserved Plasmodium protein, unknown function [Plasmodium malariae]|uniref:Uncharacterized protein n=1 Tax=Plasmodium malariae TaxID=5858 RepID=A0A1C3KZ58_PLAMA|nr:conserved Plasmodium protein, unknown function [Plasmodium malariae]